MCFALSAVLYLTVEREERRPFGSAFAIASRDVRKRRRHLSRRLLLVSMKAGPLSRAFRPVVGRLVRLGVKPLGFVVTVRGRVGPLERCSSLYRLIELRGPGVIGDAPVAQFQNGLLGSQTKGGACRSEGLVAGEHVPDRLGRLAGELDLGDLGAALAAEATLGALVALPVERV